MVEAMTASEKYVAMPLIVLVFFFDILIIWSGLIVPWRRYGRRGR
jgi:hypothetical protein